MVLKKEEIRRLAPSINSKGFLSILVLRIFLRGKACVTNRVFQYVLESMEIQNHLKYQSLVFPIKNTKYQILTCKTFT